MNENKQNDESWYIKSKIGTTIVEKLLFCRKIYHFQDILDAHMRFIRNDLLNAKIIQMCF